MKKIHVQGRMSIFAAALIIIGCISLCGWLFWFVFIHEPNVASANTKGRFFELLGIIVFFIPLLFSSAIDKTKYVSDLIITSSELKLVYKIKNKVTKIKSIPLSEIETFKAAVEANDVQMGRGVAISATTTVTIKLYDGKKIIFKQEPLNSFCSCPYGFFLKLYSMHSELPNFSSDIEGGSKAAREDILYYMQHGRHIPFVKKNIPLHLKIILIISFSMLLLSFGMLAWLHLPSGIVSSEEKQYVEHLDTGYRYYQADMYDDALREYKKAQNFVDNDPELYLREAWCYQGKKDYKKVIETCDIAIANIENKSAYKKVKNYKFDTKKDVSIYTARGKANFRLKNYSEAEKDFSKVIDSVKYTYTDAYNWRGYARWWQKNYTGALEDLYKHREIMKKYFEDQAQSEYKDRYPRYDSDDLQKVNQAIKELGGI